MQVLIFHVHSHSLLAALWQQYGAHMMFSRLKTPSDPLHNQLRGSAIMCCAVCTVRPCAQGTIW